MCEKSKSATFSNNEFLTRDVIKNKMNVFRRMTSDKATDSRVDKHPKRKVTDIDL